MSVEFGGVVREKILEFVDELSLVFSELLYVLFLKRTLMHRYEFPRTKHNNLY